MLVLCEDAVTVAVGAVLVSTPVDPPVGAADVVGAAEVVGVGVGVGVSVLPVVQAWNSASPVLRVSPPTPVTVSRIEEVTSAGNVTVLAAPVEGSAPTVTVLPSENVRVAEVMSSEALGRSNSVTLPIRRGSAQFSWTQLPTPPPSVAHSAVWSPG